MPKADGGMTDLEKARHEGGILYHHALRLKEENATLRATLRQAEAALLQANECGYLRGGGLCRVCRLGNSVTLAAIRVHLEEER